MILLYLIVITNALLFLAQLLKLELKPKSSVMHEALAYELIKNMSLLNVSDS